jgi:hypothetical protein
MSFVTRRIFKSAITSQNLIRELLQQMILSELLSPAGDRAWLVSPWISNVVLLDNPDWGEREIRLIEILVYLMARGTPLGIATSFDDHNDPLLTALKIAAQDAGVEDRLVIVRRGLLHTKGLLFSRGLLTGSMNLTFKGLELNDEHVIYDTTRQPIAQARIAFESYLSGDQ